MIKLIQMPIERSTNMKYRNIEDIKESVRECANFYGFEVEDSKYSTLGVMIKTKNDSVRIDVYTDLHFDIENNTIIQNFEFCPTICKMGGKNTAKEFRAIAEEMIMAADLVEALSLRGGYELVTELPAKAE